MAVDTLCEGHESLRGDHMGETVYCDGSCVGAQIRAEWRPGGVRPAGAGWLMEEIRTSWDSDEWGTVMGWWFAVADVLWHWYGPAVIPAEWKYRHSPVCDAPDDDDYPTSEVVRLVQAKGIGPNGLVYVGRVLDRYADWLIIADKDY